MDTRPGWYYWRSHAGAEVDLVLEINGSYYPIEIKAKTNPSRRDTTGITAFRKTFPGLDIRSGLVVCACDRIFKLSENDFTLPYCMTL